MARAIVNSAVCVPYADAQYEGRRKMSSIRWNKSQRAAIEFRGKNLLLSAAAGSGKTATLTQRIIELLCDPSSGADISSMLVLTFTNDAAAELKSRISAALSDAIARDPSDKRLLRQLRCLDSAAISTTHSFLINELRPYFMRFDLPPDFSICDEASVAQLRRELMADTVNDYFDGVCKCDDFILLADTLSGAKDDETLDSALLGIWKSLMSLGLEPSFLRENRSDGDFLLTGVGMAAAEKMKELSSYYRGCFEFFVGELGSNEATAKNSEVAASLRDIACELGNVACLGYLPAKVFLSDTVLPSCKSVKKEDSTDEYEQFKALRGKFKDELDSLKSKFFALSPEVMAETEQRIFTVSCAVSHVLDEFERRFAEAKRERGKIDFNDAERFAARLFCNPDGSPTEEALEVAKKYSHIFIDEYQDTNRLQDMIYTVLSHCGSRFMVGDVKQSVYQFRGARPENFVKYRREYEAGGDGTAIFMSENHRSDSGVIDFSNLISDYMFPFSETPFEREDRLVCAKSGGADGTPCQVVLVEENEKTEADYVASRIKEMIGRDTLRNGERVRARDIAVIMRTGALSAQYKRALEARGVPVKNSASENFFDHSEVLLLISILSAIDNPTADIPLAAAMKSPVFGFSLEDMVILRGKDKMPLWYSVCRYAEENSDGLALRLKEFVRRLEGYREMSRNMLCDKLLYYIITDTGFNALRDDSGSGRLRRSVKKMYSHAIKCAESGGSLHDLIVYMKGLMEGKDQKDAAADEDAVTIISTHRSKGLEYPICFLCDTARQFNTLDANSNSIIDPVYGLYMKLPDPEGIIRCDTPYRNAAALSTVFRQKEEEMRVLYVALTRARERLIVTLRTMDGAKAMADSRARTKMGANAYSVRKAESAAIWLLDAVNLNLSHPSFEFLRVRADDIREDGDTDKAVELSPRLVREAEEKLRACFDFTYDKTYLSLVPAKLPVSKLSPRVLDEGYSDRREAPPMPMFLAGEKQVSAAEKGTATHMFLQFCDFSALVDGAKREGERLCSLGFISREMLELIRFDEIETFAKSDLCKSIISAVEMYREVRFNHMMDASDFTENEALREKLVRDSTRVCVQGVVDCLFKDKSGRTVLVDYKTDRLTKGELEDKSLAAKKLISRHGQQLYMYKKLCAEMLGREIDSLLIYSLALGDTIELT